ncbi:MAG: HdeD family acid-resistance protein [Xanthobacter sp.]
MIMPTGSAAFDRLHSLRANWGWFVVLGIIFVLLGFFALSRPLLSTLAVTLYVGALLLVGGVVQVIHAFRARGWGSFIYWLLAGVLYIVAGGLTMYRPVAGASIITIFIGAALAVEGIFRLFAGFSSRAGRGWGWIVFSGLISLILGLLIISGWPTDTVEILGIFLGVDLVFTGVGAFFFGLSLRQQS